MGLWGDVDTGRHCLCLAARQGWRVQSAGEGAECAALRLLTKPQHSQQARKAIPADGGACGRPEGMGLTEDYPQSSRGE